MSTGKTETHRINDFKYEYNSLITLNIDDEAQILQFNNAQNDNIRYGFNYKGNNIELSVLDERQY